MDPLDLQLNRLCRLVIDLEARLATGLELGPRTVPLDTPGLGALVAVDVFGALRPGTVATILGMSTGGTTKVLQRLESAGLVVRHLGSVPGDRRGVVIELTDAGRSAIRGTEGILVDQAPLWAEALDPSSSPSSSAPAAPRGPAVPTTPAELDPSPGVSGPAVATLFHLVGALDQVVIENVDGIAALHPADPRGLLVLTELDHLGPMPAGAVATLIGRSRAAANALLAGLDDAGVVVRGPATGGDDRRLVLVRITGRGRRVLARLTAALEARSPELRPLVDAFLATLASVTR